MQPDDIQHHKFVDVIDKVGDLHSDWFSDEVVLVVSSLISAIALCGFAFLYAGCVSGELQPARLKNLLTNSRVDKDKAISTNKSSNTISSISVCVNTNYNTDSSNNDNQIFSVDGLLPTVMKFLDFKHLCRFRVVNKKFHQICMFKIVEDENNNNEPIAIHDNRYKVAKLIFKREICLSVPLFYQYFKLMTEFESHHNVKFWNIQFVTKKHTNNKHNIFEWFFQILHLIKYYEMRRLPLEYIILGYLYQIIPIKQEFFKHKICMDNVGNNGKCQNDYDKKRSIILCTKVPNYHVKSTFFKYFLNVCKQHVIKNSQSVQHRYFWCNIPFMQEPEHYNGEPSFYFSLTENIATTTNMANGLLTRIVCNGNFELFIKYAKHCYRKKTEIIYPFYGIFPLICAYLRIDLLSICNDTMYTTGVGPILALKYLIYPKLLINRIEPQLSQHKIPFNFKANFDLINNPRYHPKYRLQFLRLLCYSSSFGHCLKADIGSNIQLFSKFQHKIQQLYYSFDTFQEEWMLNRYNDLDESIETQKIYFEYFKLIIRIIFGLSDVYYQLRKNNGNFIKKLSYRDKNVLKNASDGRQWNAIDCLPSMKQDIKEFINVCQECAPGMLQNKLIYDQTFVYMNVQEQDVMSMLIRLFQMSEKLDCLTQLQIEACEACEMYDIMNE